MSLRKVYIFASILCLSHTILCQINNCTTQISKTGNFTMLTFSCIGSGYPILDNAYLTNPSQFDIINFSDNLFTTIPIDLLCGFSNAFHVNLRRNQIKAVNTIGDLKCLKKLTELNLSFNLIQYLNSADFNDEMSLILEYIDLSKNAINTLDTSFFLKRLDDTVTRFPKLRHFSISENKLTEFDLLMPLSLPNPILNFDVSSNSIKSFRNFHKKSFRENPYIVDYNSKSRFVNLTNNHLNGFDNDILKEYGVGSVWDFEIFISRISNYLMNNQKSPLYCKCPSFRQNGVDWFKQLTNINQNLSLFELRCSNIDGNAFAFNYTCGVIVTNFKFFLNFFFRLCYFITSAFGRGQHP